MKYSVACFLNSSLRGDLSSRLKRSIREPSEGPANEEFEKGRKSLTVNPQGPLTFDDSELVIEAVLKGVGIGMALEPALSEMIAKGRLVQVLKGWCPTFPGYFLYYPSRRNQPAALAALINTFRKTE
jgi:DNA-binding transcriptional LysR family regulator